MFYLDLYNKGYWSLWLELAACQIKFGRVKRLPFKRRPLSIPCLFQSVDLLFLLCCRQAHLLPLLLVHYLANGSLGLVVKILQRLRVVHFGRIDLFITFEDSAPYLILCLFQVQNNEGFIGWFLYLLNRLRRANFLIELTFDDRLASFFLDTDWIVFQDDIQLNNLFYTCLLVMSDSTAMVTSTSFDYWLQLYRSFEPPL
jgi:hypothetical protein